MGKHRTPYPAEFRAQMIELVKAGRRPVSTLVSTESGVWKTYQRLALRTQFPDAHKGSAR